jgi:hypothetical protein
MAIKTNLGKTLDKIVKESLAASKKHPTPYRSADLAALESIGVGIAFWSDWDGLVICKIFRAALEDANFHAQAAEVSKWMGDK